MRPVYFVNHGRLAHHTDNRDGAEYNLALSLLRAESVRNYLIFRGVSKYNLNAQGYGDSRPIAGNDTGQGRALNRRVELRILPDE